MWVARRLDDVSLHLARREREHSPRRAAPGKEESVVFVGKAALFLKMNSVSLPPLKMRSGNPS